MQFKIEKKGPGLARAGKIVTAHGEIETPAFVVVGTKATVKALTPEQVKSLGAQVVLANTYHLYLQPGDELVKKAGGLGKFMNWNGPTMTDSGGFQAFSLGVAYGSGINKFIGVESPSESEMVEAYDEQKEKAAKITEDGVEFKSVIDGSFHFFSPEKSIQIQHNIGADIIFAFDECTSPHAPKEYLRSAMERTHRWAERSLREHRRLASRLNLKDAQGLTLMPPALFGIVQGGRYEDLRKESAEFIGKMDFAGFGIGGSFVKEDMPTAVKWVNTILPEEKPRHLLGIGEPEDLFAGVENGVDTFDCVTPTRLGRNGALMTKEGRINILNTKYQEDFAPVEEGCGCYTCQHYTRAYLAHLFRAKEMLASTLASIHNLYFAVNLVKQIRQALLDDNLSEFKKAFFSTHNK